MFNFLKKNPKDKLLKEYNSLLEQAMHAQRNGNIELYSKLSARADDILKEIEKLEAAE